MMNDESEKFNQMYSMEAQRWTSIIPHTIPWSLQPQPSLVHFTAGGGDFNCHSVKRKPSPDLEVPAPKQFISEEKMAAHMSNLSITENLDRLVGQDDSTSCTDIITTGMSVDTLNRVTCEKNDLNKLPKLTLCEEVRKLKAEPVIPHSILSKLERPQLAVVLWQPPVGPLEQLKELKHLKDGEDDVQQKTEDAHVYNNNNNDLVLDDAMELESNGNENTFRPIDPVPDIYQPNNQFRNQIMFPTPHFTNSYDYSS